MPLRIDPTLPLVWRSPDSVQLGVDRVVVVLESLSTVQERMLAALLGGTSRPALDLIAEAAGATPADAAAFMRLVAPALVPVTPTRQLGDVVVSGTGATAECIRSMLEERGLLVRERTAADRPEIAVIVAQFVVDPADRACWLSRDVPHLPVVLGDREGQLGPLVEPGASPCLYCLELHRRDADPAWVAIASQLWTRASPIDTPLFAGEIASQVMRIVEARLATAPVAGREATATALRIDAQTGARVTRDWVRHVECGCAAPPESGSADDHRFAAAPSTTTGSGVPALS